MVTAPEIHLCACGLVMHETRIGSGTRFCENCDHTQPEEESEGRIRTKYDRAFEAAWKRRVGDMPKLA